MEILEALRSRGVSMAEGTRLRVFILTLVLRFLVGRLDALGDSPSGSVLAHIRGRALAHGGAVLVSAPICATVLRLSPRVYLAHRESTS